jgi:hypothetical protein
LASISANAASSALVIFFAFVAGFFPNCNARMGGLMGESGGEMGLEL